jgi:hypothetical protein
MARVRYTKNSFSVGVISEKVRGNTDFEQYNNALEECVNFQVQQTGGLFKRGGSVFVAECRSSGYVRIIPFIYDEENQYICEFGEKYIRFFNKKGVIEKNSLDEEVVVATPFTEDTLRTMKTFQDGNILVLLTDVGMYELRRKESTVFELSNKIQYTCEPLTFLNKENISLKPSADSGAITFSAVDTLNPNQKPKDEFAPVFVTDDATHEMCLIYKIKNDVTGLDEEVRYYLRINTVQKDPTNNKFNTVTAVLESEKCPNNATKLPNTDPVRKWQVGAFNKTRGMPKASAVFEGRLFLASNTSYPAGIWGSSKLYNDWTDFFMGAQDTDAVQFKIAAKHSDSILWMIGQSKLFIGTRWGIYIAGSATYNDEAITPSNFSCRLFDSTGASELQPIEALDSVFFVDSSGKNVHEIVLSGETGTFQAHDVSVLANDLTQSGIIAHTWQQTPVKTYWCAVNDGFLCALTYLKENGIMAWTKHVIAGENVKVEDLACLHGTKNDLLWMVVRRQIGGEFKRFIEYIHPPFNPQDQELFKQNYSDFSASKEIKFNILDIVHSKHAVYKLTDEEVINPDFIISKDPEINCNLLFIKGYDSTAVHSLFYGKFNRDELEIVAQNFPGFVSEDKHLILCLNNSALGRINRLTSSNTIYYSACGKLKQVDNVISENELTYITANTNNLADGDTVVLIPTSDISNLFDNDKPLDYWYEKKIYGVEHSVKLVGENRVFLYDGSTPFILPIVPKDRNQYCEFTIAKKLKSQLNNIKTELSASKVYIDKIDSFPARSFEHIHINKVGKSFNSDDFIYFRTIITLKEKDHLQLWIPHSMNGNRYRASLLDTSKFAPYDNVNPTGNLYLYFKSIEVPHLKGMEVTTMYDGRKGKNLVVPETGIIKTQNMTGANRPVAMYVSVGLPMTSTLKTTSLSLGSLLGSSVGTVGGQKNCFLNLYYSNEGEYGSNSDDLYPIPYNDKFSKFTRKDYLKSGLVKCPMVNSTDIYNRSVYIKHSAPVAFNILSITQDVEVSDS